MSSQRCCQTTSGKDAALACVPAQNSRARQNPVRCAAMPDYVSQRQAVARCLAAGNCFEVPATTHTALREEKVEEDLQRFADSWRG